MIRIIAVLVAAAIVGFGTTAPALDITAGPSDTLPGGAGSCTVSGTLARGSGATWNCTISNAASFADVYFGISTASTNGNEMDGSGPSGFEIFRYSGRTAGSITYTSSTTMHNVFGSSTQPVNTRLVLTLTSGTGDVVDTEGVPANSSTRGDVQKLFRITSSSFSVHVEVQSNTLPIPVFGESNPNVYDVTHTLTSVHNVTKVHLAFYYKTC